MGPMVSITDFLHEVPKLGKWDGDLLKNLR